MAPIWSISIFKHLNSSLVKAFQRNIFQRSNSAQDPSFGLLFDIDGVLLQGNKPISAAVDAFERLTRQNGKLCVPTVFVTNAGNASAKTKAKQLSKLLNVEITSSPVMMSHSPLRMFREFHHKCVLLSGQGPVETIARNIGFTNIITIDQIRDVFPNLDMVDHSRRPKKPLPYVTANFPQIEALVLFGEPVRWETSLQLLIDVLLTNGRLTDPVHDFTEVDTHLPVLACNTDLLWMAGSQMPRFGHGTFLHCLESLFRKLVGRPLTYTALMGKPSEITYAYAERLVMRQAAELGLQSPIRTLYAVGDNPMADIYGANLFNRILKEKQNQREQKRMTSRSVIGSSQLWEEESPYQIPPVFHSPRDIDFDVSLCMPTHVTRDVNTALDYIELTEGFKFGPYPSQSSTV